MSTPPDRLFLHKWAEPDTADQRAGYVQIELPADTVTLPAAEVAQLREVATTAEALIAAARSFRSWDSTAAGRELDAAVIMCEDALSSPPRPMRGTQPSPKPSTSSSACVTSATSRPTNWTP
jgi:hypothetical protein